jgi:prepilin-type N-terminal cleavage/methylation domain-containing protein
MYSWLKMFQQSKIGLHSNRGFSLVELMIAMAVSSIVIVGAYSTYNLQSKTFLTQRDISKIQQNLRGASNALAWDIHNSQRDPNPVRQCAFKNFGWSNGNPTLTFDSLRLDTDIPPDGIADTVQQIRYEIDDPDGDGRPGLYRTATPSDPGSPPGLAGIPQLVADGVASFGLAYAFDADDDGLMERYNNNPNGRILWAVDSDGNGNLDAILDTNDDGVIDELDDAGTGDNRITAADDAIGHLATPVSFNRVRAVRVFLLAVSERETKENMVDLNTYTVGNQVIVPPNPPDRFKRRVLTFDVALRNY